MATNISNAYVTPETQPKTHAQTTNEPHKNVEPFKHFLYNSQNGEIMNRSVGSWLQLLLFYLVFYGLLAAFWAMMLVVFMQTLSDDRPKWTGKGSAMSSYAVGDAWGPGEKPILHKCCCLV